MKNGRFEKLHSGVLLCYYVVAALSASVFLHPVLLAISLLFVCGYTAQYFGPLGLARRLQGYLPFTIVIALINPLFNHAGSTVLFYLWQDPITLEAFVYGVMIGLMLMNVVLWFGCMQQRLSSDKIAGIFGRALPTVGLMLGMVFRYIEYLKSRYVHLKATQSTFGISTDSGKLKDRLRCGAALLGVVLSQGLEAGVDTAFSMRARGYDTAVRHKDKVAFSALDRAVAILSAIMAGLWIYLGITGGLSFAFYPLITMHKTTTLSIIVYVFYVLFFSLPILTDITEELRWRFIRSKT